ncbi:MAG: PAS domain-containing sensor histidine kinase, partial [Nitrospinales bacterium]
ITLLILFGAIWLGFYMAKGITIPIQQLAEGTRRIAEGNMNFKINVRANDEIGLLVDSFNNMTDELNESRMKIHNVHEDLKLTNIELERRRNYIESILENIGAGVISLNKKGHITTFNKAAEKILDISPVNVLGSSYKDVFDQSYHEPIRNIIKGIREESKESFEKQIELRVGENNLTLLVNVKVLRDRGKRYLGLVIVFEDLTQLIKAQKIAAWQEVAQGIAHEIKNPLTPIQLNTQRLLKKYYENKEEFPRIFDESIKIIIQEVKSMKDLLDEFMRFSRMPTPNPKPTSLHSIIDDVSLLYSNHNEKIKIIKNYDPNLNVINIDSEQMRRVFINLFENAKAAIPSKGEIQITTRLHSPSNMVKIEFSDNGVGVPPEDREKLFLPHFTTKKRGTGLGLAIVNRIIVDHNGTIHIRENPPRGTIFTIELPYSSTDLKFESENFEHKQDFRKTSPPF